MPEAWNPLAPDPYCLPDATYSLISFAHRPRQLWAYPAMSNTKQTSKTVNHSVSLTLTKNTLVI